MWHRRDEVIHDIDVELNAGRLVWSYDDVNSIILPFPKHRKRYDTVYSGEGSEPGDANDAGSSDSSHGGSGG